MFRRAKIRNRQERIRRIGFFVSSLLHSALMAAILGAWIAGIELPVVDPLLGRQKSVVQVASWEKDNRTPYYEIDVAQAADANVRQIIASPLHPDTFKSSPDLTLSSKGEPQLAIHPPVAAESVSMSEFVRSRVERAGEEAAKLDTDQKFARLEEAAKKLDEVASPASIDELANKFQKWMSTEKRADKPADKPVAGPFDFTSAQIHDVRRDGSEQQGFQYTSILIDSAGRTMETPLSPEEGENLYRTMQLIKSNPLLEKVYRGIVMGMLDKMLKNESTRP